MIASSMEAITEIQMEAITEVQMTHMKLLNKPLSDWSVTYLLLMVVGYFYRMLAFVGLINAEVFKQLYGSK